MGQSRSVAISIYVGTGSRHELPDEAGVSICWSIFVSRVLRETNTQGYCGGDRRRGWLP